MAGAAVGGDSPLMAHSKALITTFTDVLVYLSHLASVWWLSVNHFS